MNDWISQAELFVSRIEESLVFVALKYFLLLITLLLWHLVNLILAKTAVDIYRVIQGKIWDKPEPRALHSHLINEDFWSMLLFLSIVLGVNAYFIYETSTRQAYWQSALIFSVLYSIRYVFRKPLRSRAIIS